MERDRDWLFPAAAISVMAVLIAMALSFATGYPGHPSRMTSLKAAVAIITLTAFFRFVRYFFGLWRAGVERPAASILSDLRPAILSFAPIVAGVAILSPFLHSITFLKSMIVAVVPFWADAPLAELDRLFLISPAGLARAFQPIITELGVFYALWHAVQLGGILWVLHWRGCEDKARLVLGFMLTWSIGMAFAYIFSSAGPIFVGDYDISLTPDLMQRAARLLWTNYQAKGAIVGGGISAFPSMHVAIAVWFALVLSTRRLGWLGWSYAIGVYSGSVILGWHYAADGVAGAAIALIADRLAKSWVRQGRTYIPTMSQPAAAPS